MSRDRNQEWWTEEVAKAVGEKKEVQKRMEKIKDRGSQPEAGLMHLYRQKKKAARREWGIRQEMTWKRRYKTSLRMMVGRK